MFKLFRTEKRFTREELEDMKKKAEYKISRLETKILLIECNIMLDDMNRVGAKNANDKM